MVLLSTVSRSNWNLEMLVFVEGGKPEYPEKNSRSRDENQLNQRITPSPGIGPVPRWREASTLTTSPLSSSFRSFLILLYLVIVAIYLITI